MAKQGTVHFSTNYTKKVRNVEMLLRRSEILQLMSTHTKYQVHPSIINASKPKKIFRPQNLGIKSLTTEPHHPGSTVPPRRRLVPVSQTTVGGKHQAPSQYAHVVRTGSWHHEGRRVTQPSRDTQPPWCGLPLLCQFGTERNRQHTLRLSFPGRALSRRG